MQPSYVEQNLSVFFMVTSAAIDLNRFWIAQIKQDLRGKLRFTFEEVEYLEC